MPKVLRSFMALFVMAAFLLTACASNGGTPASSPSSDAASASKDASNERIVSLGYGDADTLLALGITPVGLATWGSEGEGDPSGLGPWAKDKLGSANPAVLYDVARGIDSKVLEKVAALKPTKIIAVNQAVDAAAQAELNKIAPTTVHDPRYQDWQVPWDSQVRSIAKAVGKEADGEKLIKESEKAVADLANKHKDASVGKKAAIGMPYSGKLGLYASGDARGEFIEKLGFQIPEELNSKESYFMDLSPENWTKLDQTDYFFVCDYLGSSEALKKDPIFQGLNISKNGRVVYLDNDTSNAMSMLNPLTISYVTKNFDTAFSKVK